jgi:modification methylase
MAKVRADGTLIADQVKGSIHKVGAELEGAPSCNGWTYWHFKRDGQMVPIDVSCASRYVPRWRRVGL